MEDGWSYGSVPLAYALACIFWVLPVAVLFLFGFLDFFWAAIIGILGVVIIPIITFRWTKQLWVGIYYAVLPHEMDAPEVTDES